MASSSSSSSNSSSLSSSSSSSSSSWAPFTTTAWSLVQQKQQQKQQKQHPTSPSSSSCTDSQPTPRRTYPRLNERMTNVASYAAFTEEFELDPTLPYEKAMIAGASAGVMEHFCMFPVDTIKTRLQVLEPAVAATASAVTTTTTTTSTVPHSRYTSIFDAVRRIHAEEGLLRLYRGVGLIVLGAIPSHALNYASYEYFKHQLGGDLPGHHPLAHAAAGSLATLLHDAVTTPLDVVKQRLQMYGSTYSGVAQCVRTVLKEEGVGAFFASYPTTVMMNVPFMSVHFAGYEAFKRLLTGSDASFHEQTSPKAVGEQAAGDEEETPAQVALELLAGGMAGGCAGLVSTPFDVVKTRVQTQHATGGHKRLNARAIVRQIWRTEGATGLFRGASARVLYFVPSATICWGTYEFVKRALKEAW